MHYLQFLSNNTKNNDQQLQLQEQIQIQKQKNTSSPFVELTSQDLDLCIAQELVQETTAIKSNLHKISEIQQTLIEQITIIDQENLDSIENHFINSNANMDKANKKLDSVEKNTPSYINPFKNISNILSLLGLISKKN